MPQNKVVQQQQKEGLLSPTNEKTQQKQYIKSNKNNNDKNKTDNNNNKSKTKQEPEGILASPKNPTTVRRLSQTDDVNKEISWHKRVVVHRVPRSDDSRSMFRSKGKESNNANQCCVVL
eukprot:128723_1